MLTAFRRLLREESGATAIEYGLICAGIAAAPGDEPGVAAEPVADRRVGRARAACRARERTLNQGVA